MSKKVNTKELFIVRNDDFQDFEVFDNLGYAFNYIKEEASSDETYVDMVRVFKAEELMLEIEAPKIITIKVKK